MKNKLTTIFAMCACMLTGTEAGAVISNGGFESGLSGYTVHGSNALTKSSSLAPLVSTGLGNAFTTGNLDGLLPTEGSSFAVIANGDLSGKTSPLTATQISQTITLGTGLLFDYDFLTNEINQPSLFNDAFCVTLSTMSGPLFTLNTLSLKQNGFVAGQGGFEGGTGWLTDFIDTSDFVGQAATLAFTVYDVGDSAYNSALAIDNIRTIQPAVAPEPGTIAFGAGLLGVCLAAMARRGLRR